MVVRDRLGRLPKVSSGSSVEIPGYGRYGERTLNIRAYSANRCFSYLDDADLTVPATTSLSASVDNDLKASLTLSNYGMDWEFRIGWGTCTSVSGDTVSGIAGYQSGTYSVKAYRNGSGCGDELGATSFTIP